MTAARSAMYDGLGLRRGARRGAPGRLRAAGLSQGALAPDRRLIAELLLVQPRVEPAGASSSSWVPRSTIRPRSSDEDHVGRQDRRQAVRDRDRRAPLHQRLERGLHQPLATSCRATTSPRRGSGSSGPSGSRARSRAAASRRPTACSRAPPPRCRSPRAARRSGRGCSPRAPPPRALPASRPGAPYSRFRRIVSWNR